MCFGEHVGRLHEAAAALQDVGQRDRGETDVLQPAGLVPQPHRLARLRLGSLLVHPRVGQRAERIGLRTRVTRADGDVHRLARVRERGRPVTGPQLGVGQVGERERVLVAVGQGAADVDRPAHHLQRGGRRRAGRPCDLAVQPHDPRSGGRVALLVDERHRQVQQRQGAAEVAGEPGDPGRLGEQRRPRPARRTHVRGHLRPQLARMPQQDRRLRERCITAYASSAARRQCSKDSSNIPAPA